MVVGLFYIYINVWFHQHIMAIDVLNNTTEYELNVQKLLVKRSEFKPQTESPALGLMSGDNSGCQLLYCALHNARPLLSS